MGNRIINDSESFTIHPLFAGQRFSGECKFRKYMIEKKTIKELAILLFYEVNTQVVMNLLRMLKLRLFIGKIMSIITV